MLKQVEFYIIDFVWSRGYRSTWLLQGYFLHAVRRQTAKRSLWLQFS
jgi:hypothetical protein